MGGKKEMMIIVTTTSLAAVDRWNADRWNAARSQKQETKKGGGEKMIMDIWATNIVELPKGPSTATPAAHAKI